ncbi:hypothetical protein [Sphingomonas sp.]|uniref:hypothetical protein n=1 Tax=Sphingomonas sp. TaxID=28214 RepID=UPI003CC595DD
MALTRRVFPLLLLAAAPSTPLRPTAQDIAAARANEDTSSYPDPVIVGWQREVRAQLAHGSPAATAAAMATRYGMTAAEMERLIDLWVIVRGRHGGLENDRPAWASQARAELYALVPALRRSRLGVGVLAETLNTIEECRADDFAALTAASTDVAKDAFRAASGAPCNDNWSRAVLAAPDRSLPVLARMAEWGGLPLRDAIPLYTWLASPAALARVADADRPAATLLVRRRLLAVLLHAGRDAEALQLLDDLPPAARQALLTPAVSVPASLTLDGIIVPFEPEQGDPTGEDATQAPILGVAQALTAAGREDEARRLLATLPGFARARQALGCRYELDTAGCAAMARSLHGDGRDALPMAALPLDHLLNDAAADPYPLAETLFAGTMLTEMPNAAITCRLFPPAEVPHLCDRARQAAMSIGDLDRTDALEADTGQVARQEAALDRAIPGFAARRAALHRDAPAAAAPPRIARVSTDPEPSPFAEHPIPPARGRGAGAPAGLAPLPAGYTPVRAERSGQRTVAISVSQSLDPTGEVSRGGYWVHLSDDGGRTWRRPLYTGLAERFP